MSRHLFAVHDYDPAWAAVIRSAGKTGWCVQSESIGDDPNDRSGHDYSALAAFGVTPIVRLNYSHHGQGTIPLPSRYDAFAERCANFVSASPGCRHWILGNETNWSVERPGGVAITPRQYANCFDKCQRAIKYRSAHHHVIVAAVAPYNVETGPWLDYWREMLIAIAGDSGADGLALHFYSRGADPASIRSDTKMDAPFGHLYNGFRAYRDLLAMVPDDLRHLPAYATETNQLQPWADTNSGWVQAAYAEIDEWNADPSHQPIKCLALYRWETYDLFGIKGKQGVIDDFRAAVAKGYPSPQASNAQAEPDEVFMPNISTGPTPAPAPQPQLPPREISDDFKRRASAFVPVVPEPGKRYYRLIKAEYVPDGVRRFGPDHHILVDVLDAQGNRKMGTPVNFYWDDGETLVPINKTQEPYGADYGMTSHGHSFGVWIGDIREASDDVFGMGLGTIEQPDWNHHVSYYLVFQEVFAGGSQTTVPATSQPSPAPAPEPTQPATVPRLAHPIADPSKRRISQRFGDNPAMYARFNMAGHTGLDFAVPVGTPVHAVDDGQAVEMLSDVDGYGHYIKLKHTWGESLYAHLDRYHALMPGAIVKRGQMIALSGNSGNSTGPHLHLALRIYPYKRGHPFDGFSDPLPYLSTATTPTQPAPPVDLLLLIKAAATEFNIEWQLLASLAWAESSWNPNAKSNRGAKGLTQLMDDTWNEWRAKVGGTNVFDPAQNLNVGAAYLAWLIRQMDGNVYKALHAYVWGVGRVSSGQTPPPEVIEYATKIIHGRDLLKAVDA